jgi:hypothetical protein
VRTIQQSALGAGYVDEKIKTAKRASFYTGDEIAVGGADGNGNGGGLENDHVSDDGAVVGDMSRGDIWIVTSSGQEERWPPTTTGGHSNPSRSNWLECKHLYSDTNQTSVMGKQVLLLIKLQLPEGYKFDKFFMHECSMISIAMSLAHVVQINVSPPLSLPLSSAIFYSNSAYKSQPS